VYWPAQNALEPEQPGASAPAAVSNNNAASEVRLLPPASVRAGDGTMYRPVMTPACVNVVIGKNR